ncbi:hypothetical protein C0995_002182 [Termitomyces sp. Mi166|nr:hypothetical protein C0995_002182 [Termitomyces sp. Mi166\
MFPVATPKLTDFGYLIFDVYGTLADWESGLYTALQPLLSRFPSASKWSRDDAIRAFVSVEGDIQAQHPSMLYSDLLTKAHEVFEARLIAAENGLLEDENSKESKTSKTSERTSASAAGIPDVPGESSSSSSTQGSVSPTAADNEHMIFGKSIRKWEPFPDSAKALAELSKYFHLIVLSNVDHASFAYTHTYLSEGTFPSQGALSSSLYSRPSPNPHPRGLWLPRLTSGSKSPFSLVLTAQDTGTYKPAHAGFIAVLEAIRSEPYLLARPGSAGTAPATSPTLEEIKAETLSVAQSLTHDHQPAKELGIVSVWIDRQGASWRPASSDDGREYGWSWRFETLGELAQAVANEIGDE